MSEEEKEAMKLAYAEKMWNYYKTINKVDTHRVIEEADKGINVTKCDDVEEMFKELGI